MCTFVLLHRPGHRWPIIIGANRDEILTRPWRAPGRHWPEHPGVIGGLDAEAGGSWLGMNDAGLLAVVLNRRGSLGPAPGLRSRGELVLRALEAERAAQAVENLSSIDGNEWRVFNLVIADSEGAWWIRNAPDFQISHYAFPEGVSMLAADDINDPASNRIAYHLPVFRSASEPDPDRQAWDSWRDILGSTDCPDEDPLSAMTIKPKGRNYGTVSSSLIALPARDTKKDVRWMFAAGPPDRTPFLPVDCT